LFYWEGVSIAWINRARERAQMNSTPPEANSEYSRAPRASRGELPTGKAPNSRAQELHGDRISSVIAVGALLAAVVLIAAEFTTLFAVHVVDKARVRTVATGFHHAYALIPIAVLVAVLALALKRSPGGRAWRPALLALGALAVITLVIALLIDLPDAHRTGLVAAGAGFELGKATPSTGFFLETLGAVLLLIVAGTGMLASAGEAGRRAPRPEPKLR
jgi:hypothetical protein